MDILGRCYEYGLSFVSGRFSRQQRYGIFYAPDYIVSHMVSSSLSSYFLNKSFDDILSIRIVDPACGSGRFILSAFDFLCDYIESCMRRGERSLCYPEFSYFSGSLDWKQRLFIFSSSIYGVDLDIVGVSICRTNFLFRILGVSLSSCSFFSHIFSVISSHICCGHSLIDNVLIHSLSFDWNCIGGKGSFDIVLSGPPYGSLFSDLEKLYLDTVYSIGTTYSTALFIDLGYSLLCSRGIVCMIIPDYLLYDSSWSHISSRFLSSIFRIDYCGVVYPDVYVVEEIIFWGRRGCSYSFCDVYERSSFSFDFKGKISHDSLFRYY